MDGGAVGYDGGEWRGNCLVLLLGDGLRHVEELVSGDVCVVEPDGWLGGGLVSDHP